MDRLEMLYRAVIMQHSQTPQNKGELPDASAEKTAYNPTCGDMVKVQIKAEDRKIDQVQFDGEGCAISMASSSIMTELLKGKTFEDALALISDFTKLVSGEDPEDKEALGEAAALQGVVQFPTRIRCAQLAWKAVEDAINQVAADE